jgi:EAL domain-containing protein (putative c-di-GMP-specific phosphodiesterase class I)
MNGLVAMGCELGQGFHFSVPVPSEDFARDWVTPFAHKDTAEG